VQHSHAHACSTHTHAHTHARTHARTRTRSFYTRSVMEKEVGTVLEDLRLELVRMHREGSKREQPQGGEQLVS